MQFSSFQEEIVDRIAATRLARCGGPAWVPPPITWGDVVQASWPDVWSPHPSPGPLWLPDGWVDMVMAFSQHASEIAGIPRHHDSLENIVTGQWLIRRHYDDDFSHRLLFFVLEYQRMSFSICRVCGGPGSARRNQGIRTQVLCDEHAVINDER